MSRFTQEVQKPHLAPLPWGHVIRKVYKGQEHLVSITQSGFEYGGRLFPTLYAVQLEVEGRKMIGGKVQASMSSKRFFGLDKSS